jgi:hypothetical protein
MVGPGQEQSHGDARIRTEHQLLMILPGDLISGFVHKVHENSHRPMTTVAIMRRRDRLSSHTAAAVLSRQRAGRRHHRRRGKGAKDDGRGDAALGSIRAFTWRKASEGGDDAATGGHP